MANTYKIPTPAELLNKQKPPGGPPVPNMGGIPTQGQAGQRPNFPQAPRINAGSPGPAPAPVPPVIPTLPGSNAPTALPVPQAPTASPGQVAPPASGPVFTFNFDARPSVPGSEPAPGGPQTYFPGGPLLPGEVGPTGQVMPEVGHIQPGQGTPGRGEMWPDAQAPAPPIPEAPYRVTRTLAHVPRRFEVDTLAPGEGMATPVGDVFHDPVTGKKKLKLNEQGKLAWRQKEAARLKEFGTYPMSSDPNAPQPDVTPGKPVYDAFRGRWL